MGHAVTRGPRNSKATTLRSLACVVVMTLASCGDDLTFQAQMDEAERKVNPILIAHHLCPMRRNCPGGNVVFISPDYGGMRAEIYSVKDLEILNEITDVFIEEFIDTPTMAYMRIQAYPWPHPDRPSLRSQPTGRTLDITLRRNNA